MIESHFSWLNNRKENRKKSDYLNLVASLCLQFSIVLRSRPEFIQCSLWGYSSSFVLSSFPQADLVWCPIVCTNIQLNVQGWHSSSIHNSWLGASASLSVAQLRFAVVELSFLKYSWLTFARNFRLAGIAWISCLFQHQTTFHSLTVKHIYRRQTDGGQCLILCVLSHGLLKTDKC